MAHSEELREAYKGGVKEGAEITTGDLFVKFQEKVKALKEDIRKHDYVFVMELINKHFAEFQDEEGKK